MDDNDAKDNPSPDFNKLDLSQLQNFSFGTQWTQDKSSPAEARERSDRPRRDDRRPGPGDNRPDRRGFRKPAAAPGEGAGAALAAREPAGGDRRPPRDFRDGPRGDDGQARGGRFGGRNEMVDRTPYDSPYFAATFYPEDTSFNALAKTIRASCRTIELFEIARTVIGKNDRFVVVMTRKPTPDVPEHQPFYISLPDGIPFQSEEAAINHVMANHLGVYFDTAEIEIDPPKGSFQVINKCGVTGELLGPPNYHRYNQIVQQHYTARISRMSPEAYRARIETVRDPEVVNQWLAKMKKITRYTLKPARAAKPAKAESPGAEAAPEALPPEALPPEATAVATPPESTPVAPPVAEIPAAEAPAAVTFDTIEDARLHLLTQARDKVVKTVETARFHGRLLDSLPESELRSAVEGALERQRRFPLDTANGLRGRLRREHFTIFKKGSKGISYVCAVKRKFRTPGQTFSDSIGGLIAFIEANPMVRASELAAKFLGIQPPAVEKPVVEPGATTGPAPAPAPELTIEQRTAMSRMQGDLRWLVIEGYVTEFIDGRLYAAPPLVEARKREVEAEEVDPENYPEAADVPTPAKVAPAPAPEEAAPVPPEAPMPKVEVAAPAVEAPVAIADEPAAAPPADAGGLPSTA
ncbi:MAG: hypothetical protein ACHQ4G_06395 [Opitutales bacterium]